MRPILAVRHRQLLAGIGHEDAAGPSPCLRLFTHDRDGDRAGPPAHGAARHRGHAGRLALVTAATVMVAYRQLDGGIDAGKDIEHRVEAGDRRRPAQHPGDGLGRARGRGQRHDGTAALRHHDPGAHLRGPEARSTASACRATRWSPAPTARDRTARRSRGGELEMFNVAFSRGRRDLHGRDGRGADRHLHRPLRLARLQRLQGDGRRRARRHGLHPGGRRRPEHDIYFEAGTQELRGQQALNYVRERSQLSANADIGRMKRQQAFVASMINKVISASTLTRPNRVYDFVDAATRSITPDPEPGVARQAGEARPAVPRDRPRRHRVHHRAVRGLRARPQPAGLGARGRASCGQRIIADKPLDKKFSDEVVTAGDPVGGSPPPRARTSPSGTPGGDVDADAHGQRALRLTTSRTGPEHREPGLGLPQVGLTRAQDGRGPVRMVDGVGEVLRLERHAAALARVRRPADAHAGARVDLETGLVAGSSRRRSPFVDSRVAISRMPSPGDDERVVAAKAGRPGVAACRTSYAVPATSATSPVGQAACVDREVGRRGSAQPLAEDRAGVLELVEVVVDVAGRG